MMANADAAIIKPRKSIIVSSWSGVDRFCGLAGRSRCRKGDSILGADQ
jgi:hypothetical protein